LIPKNIFLIYIKMRDYTSEFRSFTKPVHLPSLSLLSLPAYVSLKRKGIRVIKWEGNLIHESLEVVRNKQLIEQLNRFLPEGAECTILIDDDEQLTRYKVFSTDKITEKIFVTWVDWIKERSFVTPFSQRLRNIAQFPLQTPKTDRLIIVKNEYVLTTTKEAVVSLFQDAISRRKSGIFLHSPDALYIQGRNDGYAVYERGSSRAK
jgi:hypothetical protein